MSHQVDGVVLSKVAGAFPYLQRGLLRSIVFRTSCLNIHQVQEYIHIELSKYLRVLVSCRDFQNRVEIALIWTIHLLSAPWFTNCTRRRTVERTTLLHPAFRRTFTEQTMHANLTSIGAKFEPPAIVVSLRLKDGVYPTIFFFVIKLFSYFFFPFVIIFYMKVT